MIDFSALRVFVAVVECGGFNAAAGRLFKTQPAVTSIIKKLEQQLNFQLFDRRCYRPELTVQGKTFYQRAKSLVEHWQHVNQFVGSLQAGIESEITIAIDMAFPMAHLHDLFQEWLNRYPQTRFHFLAEALGGACERLINHEADLVISENLMTSHAVEVIILHSEKMIAVASPDYIENNQKFLQDLSSLNACRQVILRDSSQGNLSFGVVNHSQRCTVGDLLTKKQFIMAGLGWGRLPEYLIRHELDSGRLQVLKGEHFDERLLTFSAIRLQKPAHGIIAKQIWEDLSVKYF